MMRSSLLFIAFIVVFVVGNAQTSALFLGNSYTYYNNLPKLIADIASSNGDSLFYDSNTPGGYTLQGHSTNATSLSKIRTQQWDYVILQDQSQKPSLSPAYVQVNVLPYAERLVDSIEVNDSCSKALFYMTWGRKYGDQSNCAAYPPVCTYDGMQQRLRDSYVQMAVDNDASVAPVGQAWKRSMELDSNINLYSSDNSHPSLHGSYLTACVFYSSMFHKSSFMSYIPPGISVGEGLFLQSIADSTVFDSLTTWRIDTTKNINADFAISVAFMTAVFTNMSSDQNANFLWDFGDGSTSSDKNPTHLYQNYGAYEVSLKTWIDCFSDEVIKTLYIEPGGFIEFGNIMVSVYPNPVEDLLTVSSEFEFIETEWKMTNSLGKVAARGKVNRGNNFEIQMPEQKGVYFLNIQSISNRGVVRVIRR